MQVYSRTQESASLLAERVGAEAVAQTSLISPDAGFYIYALRDEAYAAFPAFPCRQQSVHLLTSGSVPYSVLAAREHRGVMYPFQSFSRQKPVSDFLAIPIMIEGEDALATEKAMSLARTISAKVYLSDAESRARLHLAGVLANNFSNCMYALAEEQLRKAGLPFDILLPLIDETAAKVHSLSPVEAQTGPAARRDEVVMQKQLALLDDEKQQLLYQLLSEIIKQNS